MADNKENKVLNVPALRFPEFTEEWNYESLDTIAPNITSGRSKPSLGEYNLYGSTGIIGKPQLRIIPGICYWWHVLEQMLAHYNWLMIVVVLLIIH